MHTYRHIHAYIVYNMLVYSTYHIGMYSIYHVYYILYILEDSGIVVKNLPANAGGARDMGFTHG